MLLFELTEKVPFWSWSPPRNSVHLSASLKDSQEWPGLQSARVPFSGFRPWLASAEALGKLVPLALKLTLRGPF